MKSAEKHNGLPGVPPKAGLMVVNTVYSGNNELPIQQILSKWYFRLNSTPENSQETSLFPGQFQDELLLPLRQFAETIPPALMLELLDENLISDKHQYIRLLQATIINLSDVIIGYEKEPNRLCQLLEETLDFIAAFFYQHFDFEYRTTKYKFSIFCDSISLKLDYWQIKLSNSTLIADFKNWLFEVNSFPDSQLSYRKLFYLQMLLSRFEQATTIITEDYIRETFVRYNFNSDCVIEFEKGLITNRIATAVNQSEVIKFLQEEKQRVQGLSTSSKVQFDYGFPSLKEQLLHCIDMQIREAQIKNNKAVDSDILLDPESKIQTSLSVAKLAVLIRLMVADKIIINKTIAPMLRTITKLFSTLQKDEISFGSLETKYHAPDKNTVNIMREMLQKWVGLVGKL